ncbi:MAG: glycosyltransferase [Clostridia bacterium]|nr:glycosyltransferase [Clostridia bacterium]
MIKKETKKLKIGLFIDVFYPMVDGVIVVVDNYARRLCKFADVTVFAPTGRKDFDDSTLPYKVVRCRSRLKLIFLDYDLSLPSLDKDFKKALRESDLDIVHIHSPFSIGKQGLKYAKKHNIPVVSTMHSQFKKDFLKNTHSKLLTNIMLKKIMKVFNSCDECWAVNDNIGNVFVEYGAKKTPKTQNNGTDLKLMTDNKKLEELRKKYNILKEEKVFLFVGRIDKLKNIFFTVDALKILKDKGFKFKMIFVGGGIDEKELQNKITNENLSKNIILAGKIFDRNELACHYALADLFLFPSLYDASSLVQIEAASQKTPTVFIRGAVTAGTVTENVNGFLSENDASSFAQKIIDIFCDENFYNQVCDSAYKDLYVSWDDAVKKAYDDYLKLIEKKQK